MGKATVNDQCTTVGPVLTNPIITLPPGGLSTWRPEASDLYWNADEPNNNDPFTVGEIWSDPTGEGLFPRDLKPLNVQDLACPTWGLGLSTPINGDIVTTIAPPWLSLIAPPMEMFSLDPTWALECTGFWSGSFTLTNFALFDPPIALTPAALLLCRSGALEIGSSTISLPTSAPSKVYTVAGQTFTPNPSAFPIAGTTVSAGGPAVTVGGTITSLQPSGVLVVGSSAIPLLTPQATLLSDVNIDGFDVKAQSSFVVVDGVTVSAAAAGVTVSEIVNSLESGGATLDIGTGRFALSSATVAKNGSVDVQAFVGGQGKGMEVSLFLVCGFCGVLMLLI